MNRDLLIHLLLMALGYALAVMLASAITVFVMFVPTVLPDNGAWGSIYKELKSMPMFLMFGTFYTFMLALPGWLISVIIAERQNEQRKYWFGIAGIATTVVAHGFALLFVGKIFAESLTIFGSLIGGFFGGLIYWVIAGKKSGNWKVNAMTGKI